MGISGVAAVVTALAAATGAGVSIDAAQKARTQGNVMRNDAEMQAKKPGCIAFVDGYFKIAC